MGNNFRICGESSLKLTTIESGEWTSDGKAYKMTKPKAVDHLLTGDDQLGGATLTKADLEGAALTKSFSKASRRQAK